MWGVCTHIYIYIECGIPISVMVLYCDNLQKNQRPAILGAGTLPWDFFSEIHFSSGKHKALYPPSLSKASTFT